MKRPTPQTRSLIEVPGWDKIKCQREECGREFWSTPSQTKYTKYCCPDCRYESPVKVLLKKTTIDDKGCWVCTSLVNIGGYAQIKTGGILHKAHRFMYETFIGPVPDGLLVLHKCKKQKNCINPAHLKIGDDGDNAADRDKDGTNNYAFGVNHKSSILDDEKVRKIRALKGNLSLSLTAKEFGVSEGCIIGVWYHHTWKHVK